jgi:hypothetical protein
LPVSSFYGGDYYRKITISTYFACDSFDRMLHYCKSNICARSFEYGFNAATNPNNLLEQYI